jgi:hypothetical protein
MHNGLPNIELHAIWPLNDDAVPGDFWQYWPPSGVMGVEKPGVDTTNWPAA